MTALVIGVDGGGTSTRCVVATVSGEIVGRGYGGAANPLSAADPAGSLHTALRAALTGLDPALVATGVFGLAGADTAPEPAEAIAAEAWRAAGPAGRPTVVPDILVAFCGATEEPSGTALVAGTGAVAARIEDRRVTGRADGYGWLLGDEGSGTWIGRRAVRAVLATLDGRAGPTALREAVLARAAVDDATALRLVKAVHMGVAEAGPSWLARLAPVVETAARAGDATATEILDEAARRLIGTVRSLGPVSGPLVLTGSLLTEPTLLSVKVRAGLPGTAIAARDGAAGAAALALHAAGLGGASGVLAAHRRLIAGKG
ncbi:BadF/BadG/BcrA/BcrD ATPase family protein [Streptosporangium sp. NPDC051022]|uniref:N-acetylglucosamine kinase n=1 Tax=Streptosporangium sp. NPDC051022 TaxID=3155752 RepID=UPI00343C5842